MVGNADLRVLEVSVENGWDQEKIVQLVGVEKLEEILGVLGRKKSGEYLLIWEETNSGGFNIKSAWDCIKVKAPEVPWSKWVWHVAMSKKISIATCKAFNDCLSVDD